MSSETIKPCPCDTVKLELYSPQLHKLAMTCPNRREPSRGTRVEGVVMPTSHENLFMISCDEVPLEMVGKTVLVTVKEST